MKVDMKNLPDEKKKSKRGAKLPDISSAKKLFGRKPQDEDFEEDIVEEEETEETETDEEPAEEGSEEKASEGTGNVYLDSLNMYKDQYSKKLKDANLLQSNKFWIAIIVVLFFVFLSVNSNASKARNQLTVQYNRTANEVDKLTSAVTELKADLEEQARIDSVVLSNEEEDLAREDAKVQGAFVAKLQNEFSTVPADDPELYKKMDSIKKELDPYFEEDAKRIGKGAWYPYLATGIPGEWSFGSNASFSGDTMKVIWFMYADDPENPKDHSLLAYCTAVYHASDGLFYDVEVKTTTYAEANSLRGEEEEYTPNSDELSIMEQLEQLAGEMEIHTPDSSEEYENEAIDGRDEYKESVMNGEVEGEEFDDRYKPGPTKKVEESSEESSEESTNTDSDEEEGSE